MASSQLRLVIAAALAIGAAIAAQAMRLAPIGWPFAIAIYFFAWWIMLFAVLPFGVRTQHDTGEVIQGTSAGAPTETKMLRVVGWTTIVASVVFCALLLAMRVRLVPLDLAN